MTYQILKNLKTYKFKALLLSCIFCFSVWAGYKDSENISNISSAEKLDDIHKILQYNEIKTLDDYNKIKEKLQLPTLNTLRRWFKEATNTNSSKGFSEFLFRQNQNFYDFLRDFQNRTSRLYPDVRNSTWMLSNEKHFGTGFFIAPDKFITNFHVIQNLSKSTATIEEITLSQEGHNKILKIKGILALSALHDLALLETKQPVKNYLSIKKELLQEKENLFITGYPNEKLTEMQKINQKNLFLENSISFFVNMSSLDGTSGSPIVDADEQVVGVLYQSSHNLVSSVKLKNLKDFISMGLKNTPKNNLNQLVESEIENLRNLAERDDIKAQFQLGLMHFQGKGVVQNLEKALHWFRLAAKKGSAKAQHQIGLMYYNGAGTDQNYEKAFRWFQLAVEQGYVLGQYHLAWMYYQGNGVVQNHKKAFHFFRLAANQGYTKAAFNLGVMYYNGEGVPQNYKETSRWFELALKQDDKRTTSQLIWMNLKDKLKGKNYEKAFNQIQKVTKPTKKYEFSPSCADQFTRRR